MDEHFTLYGFSYTIKCGSKLLVNIQCGSLQIMSFKITATYPAGQWVESIAGFANDAP